MICLLLDNLCWVHTADSDFIVRFLFPGNFVCVALELTPVSVWQNFDFFGPAIFFVSVSFFCAAWLVSWFSVLSQGQTKGKFDFFRVSSAFCMTSRASCTCVTLSVIDCFLELIFFLSRVVFCATVDRKDFPPCPTILATDQSTRYFVVLGLSF